MAVGGRIGGRIRLRAGPRGVIAFCLLLLLGAAAIPAFARDPVAPRSSVLATAAMRRGRVPAKLASVRRSLRAALLDMIPSAERGDTSTGLSGDVRVHLIEAGELPPGVYAIPGGIGGRDFAFISEIPFSAKVGSSVGGYRMGFWPGELRNVDSDAYDNPSGFVEVNPANADMHVSAHITLGDLVTHDGAPLPKYIVLREPLLDKIELVLADLAMHGVVTDHIGILSGFRTPAYNFALGDASGRARESRHQYGDAVDLIIDSDRDGRMDDLNHDGRVSVADVRVIESAVDRVERAHPDLAGGLGLYRAIGPSGPFAHIDVRGTRARWGTADGATYASVDSRARRDEGGVDRSIATTHCQAEGASAVLCQGFRHTR